MDAEDDACMHCIAQMQGSGGFHLVASDVRAAAISTLFSDLPRYITLMPGTECLNELVSRFDGRTGWDRIAGPLHGSICLGSNSSALAAVLVVAARTKPWKKPKEKWGLETWNCRAKMQGSRENGKPRRAGGGASQQLPTSPNTGTPARSQSGISHPCDQNVETTLRNTQYFVLPGLGAWKNLKSHSDDQDTATQLVGS
jgi:hypothetical protein